MRTCPLPLPPLRQRMVEDLPMRTYSEPTVRVSLHGVADVARPFRTSPAHLGPEQVRTYTSDGQRLSFFESLKVECE